MRGSANCSRRVLKYQPCEAMGLPVSIEQCEAILGAADVSEDSPFAAMERLGLMTLAQLGNLM